MEASTHKINTLLSSKVHPEFVGIILAASAGTRLFPLTHSGHHTEHDHSDDDDDNHHHHNQDTKNEYFPKHLLPLAGKPLCHHLLDHLLCIGLQLCIMTIHEEDTVTIPSLLSIPSSNTSSIKTSSTIIPVNVGTNVTPINITQITLNHLTVLIVKLPLECSGSAEALRYLSNLSISSTMTSPSPSAITENGTASSLAGGEINNNLYPILPPKSHLIVMPADLILYHTLPSSNVNNTTNFKEDNANTTTSPLDKLADLHRKHCQTGRLEDSRSGSSISSNYYPPTAATILLSDVGEEDENGTPLKESAKAKKGGIAREDENIEFIGLSSIISPTHNTTTQTTTKYDTPNNTFCSQRILLKQFKYNVEEDKDNTGATPKLIIPKPRLRSSSSSPFIIPPLFSNNHMTIRTDCNDIHVYIFSPWIIKLLKAKPILKDISKDLIPFLISRQLKGVKSCFHLKHHDRHHHSKDDDKEHHDTNNDEHVDAFEYMEKVLNEPPFAPYHYRNHSNKKNKNARMDNHRRGSIMSDEHPDQDDDDNNDSNQADEMIIDYPFMVSAHLLTRSESKLSMRANTIPSYLYGCREIVNYVIPSTAAVEADKSLKSGKLKKDSLPNPTNSPLLSTIQFKDESKVDPKFQSIFLTGSNIGEKVQVKSSTIGRRSKLSNRCRLNNVVVMDDVTIGENCVLQNCVIGNGCSIGENCNLNECQIGHKVVIPAGTKGKGESFT